MGTCTHIHEHPAHTCWKTQTFCLDKQGAAEHNSASANDSSKAPASHILSNTNSLWSLNGKHFTARAQPSLRSVIATIKFKGKPFKLKNSTFLIVFQTHVIFDEIRSNTNKLQSYFTKHQWPKTIHNKWGFRQRGCACVKHHWLQTHLNLAFLSTFPATLTHTWATRDKSLTYLFISPEHQTLCHLLQRSCQSFTLLLIERVT